ncbi:M23 family metallopeptidase [bacterium]|nr:MAG: M23 family metallopeptidase [bacterium]
MAQKYYYYDEDSCSFQPIEYKSVDKVIFTASLLIIFGLVLAGIGITGLSFVAGTPSEIALKAENRELLSQLHKTKNRIEFFDRQLSTIAQTDNEIYRTILGIDPIDYDERKAGTGGVDLYAKFDIYKDETSSLLKWTEENVASLERRINIQQLSFDEIKTIYNENKSKLAHIPATKPVKGVILSGFGMRFHPVHRFNRMHEGLDFRAKIGDPVYATGDGVIKFSAAKGTYGNLIIVNHSFGYESRFAHLSGFAKGIRPGKKIKRGELIGYSGDTGVVEGPHLHYEIYQNGKPVDPLNFLFADISPEEYNMFRKISSENPNSMD